MGGDSESICRKIKSRGVKIAVYNLNWYSFLGRTVFRDPKEQSKEEIWRAMSFNIPKLIN